MPLLYVVVPFWESTGDLDTIDEVCRLGYEVILVPESMENPDQLAIDFAKKDSKSRIDGDLITNTLTTEKPEAYLVYRDGKEVARIPNPEAGQKWGTRKFY